MKFVNCTSVGITHHTAREESVLLKSFGEKSPTTGNASTYARVLIRTAGSIAERDLLPHLSVSSDVIQLFRRHPRQTEQGGLI